jgi:hypothetical protein
VTSGTIADARLPSGLTRDSELENVSPIYLSGTTYSLMTCGDTQVLKYNTTSGTWECRADDTGAGGTITGSGAAGYLARWTAGSAISNSYVIQLTERIHINASLNGSSANFTEIYQNGETVLDISGIDGSNVTSGTIADARIASTIARGSRVDDINETKLENATTATQTYYLPQICFEAGCAGAKINGTCFITVNGGKVGQEDGC